MNPIPTTEPPAFYTEASLAEFLGLAPITLRTWRANVKGPKYIKVGRLIRYKRSDVETWLTAQTIGKRG